MRKMLFFIMIIGLAKIGFGQDSEVIGKTMLGGQWINVMLTDEGDTLYVADNLMQEISLTSPRKFKSRGGLFEISEVFTLCCKGLSLCKRGD